MRSLRFTFVFLAILSACTEQSPSTTPQKLTGVGVSKVVVNEGAAQRSRVTVVKAVFDSGGLDRALLAQAFTLRQTLSGFYQGTAPTLSVAIQEVAGTTEVTLGFSGPGTESSSLADGSWELSVAHDKVRASDKAMGSDYHTTIYRLFGDSDGSGAIDSIDNAVYGAAQGTSSGTAGFQSYLDFNGDGVIDVTDRNAFRSRQSLALYSPHVTASLINGGDAQRSRVTSVKVTFDTTGLDAVSLSKAFSLSQTLAAFPHADSPAIGTSISEVNGKTEVILSFSGAGTETSSLADGLWRLTISHAQVQASGAQMGADFVIDVPRLFGDIDANGTVDSDDETAFLAASGTTVGSPGYQSAFDFNADGVIDVTDRNEFRSRIGLSL